MHPAAIAAVAPDRPAIVMAGSGRVITYRQLEARLSKYKCPRSVDFEEQLPRLETGKLYKRLLRDRHRGQAVPARQTVESGPGRP